MLNISLSGSLCQIIAFSLQAPAPPFPVFVIAYTINGIGIALQVWTHGTLPYASNSWPLGCSSQRLCCKSQRQRRGKDGLLARSLWCSLILYKQNGVADKVFDRCWCLGLPPRSNTILSHASLVFPFPSVPWNRYI